MKIIMFSLQAYHIVEIVLLLLSTFHVIWSLLANQSDCAGIQDQKEQMEQNKPR